MVMHHLRTGQLTEALLCPGVIKGVNLCTKLCLTSTEMTQRITLLIDRLVELWSSVIALLQNSAREVGFEYL